MTNREEKVYIIVSFQDQNWEDDGGAHDPALLHVTTDQLEQLSKTDMLSKDSDLYNELDAARVNVPMPVTIHWYGTVWTEY